MTAAAPDPVLLYRIRDTLYVNVTPACTASCVFCARERRPVVRGHDLGLPGTPPESAYVDALNGALAEWHPDELVFCGFGEPTLRLRLVCTLARIARRHGVRVRLNTNGHGSLVWGRPICRRLRGLVDAISVSVNAADEASYRRVMRPALDGAFEAALAFVAEAREHVREVTVTAVSGLPGVDVEAVRDLARRLGVGFRVRSLGRVG